MPKRARSGYVTLIDDQEWCYLCTYSSYQVFARIAAEDDPLDTEVRAFLVGETRCTLALVPRLTHYQLPSDVEYTGLDVKVFDRRT